MTKLKLEIYGEDWCPYTVAAEKYAKWLLTSKKVSSFGYKQVSSLPEKETAILSKKSKDYKFIPMVFINGTFIGGLHELYTHFQTS